MQRVNGILTTDGKPGSVVDSGGSVTPRRRIPWKTVFPVPSRTRYHLAMAGIVFLRTNDLDRIIKFYSERLGMSSWLSQPDIEILSHENFLVGFHRHGVADTDALLTFFFGARSDVDTMYGRLEDVAVGPPTENERYRIYNFFGKDPDGRKFEVQAFLHEIPPVDGIPRYV